MHTSVTDCDRLIFVRKAVVTPHPHSQLSLSLHYTHIQGLWDTEGNDNRDMLMCANDAVIS